MKLERFKNQEGAAIVEFAIVFPLLIVMTFGIIEFGVVMYDKAVITNAAREGARFGILYEEPSHTDADIIARVTTFLTDANGNSLLYSLGGNSTVSIQPPPQPYPRARTAPLSVTVVYPYQFLLVPNFIPGLSDTMTLSSTTTMMME